MKRRPGFKNKINLSMAGIYTSKQSEDLKHIIHGIQNVSMSASSLAR